jgi:uncharacterized protein (TIGR02246 family)
MKIQSSDRTFFAARLAAVAVLLAWVVPMPVATAETPDESAIRQIVNAQVAAWNAGDGKAYAAHFAADGSFTNLFGMVMYGQAAFAQRHSDILAGIYKGTEKKEIITRVRFVTPDVAIVDIDNEIHGVTTLPAGIVVPADGVLRTKLMQVFVKRDGAWWIEAYHNVDLKPPQKPVSAP